MNDDVNVADESDDEEVEGDERGDDIEYDVAEWSGQSRGLLGSLLDSNGVSHAWQGTTLFVSPTDEELVDSLIDEALASATPSLDIDRERVAYEVGSWSAATQTALANALTDGDIAYEWDENGDLMVYADDESAVEAIFEELDVDDQVEGRDDGLEVSQTLAALWSAASDLAKRPKDAQAVLAVAEQSRRMEVLGIPFGFEPTTWHGLVDSAVAMRSALDDDDPDSQWSDEDVKEAAAELRDALRRYV